MKGYFVTLEGVEGSGKSTTIHILDQKLQDKGYKTFITREPGGSLVGEQIRNILIENKLSPLTELFLFLANRNDHIHNTILPHLEKGYIVLCDRFYHSTFAYQAKARHLDLPTVKSLNTLAIENVHPNSTFLIDLPVNVGLARKKNSKKNLDVIETEPLSFHEKVREAYLQLQKEDPNMYLVNGEKTSEEISNEILEIILKNL